jgi:hypothetical protein
MSFSPSSSHGGSQPSGAGSPVGVVTPSGIGSLYVNETDGTLYIASGATSADWVIVGGVTAGQTGEARGAGIDPTGRFIVLGGTDRDTPLNGPGLVLSDAYAQWNGNGAGLVIVGNGTDGEQALGWSNDAGSFNVVNSEGALGPPPGGIFFPTADPHINGAWWDNAGVLTKSAG